MNQREKSYQSFSEEFVESARSGLQKAFEIKERLPNGWSVVSIDAAFWKAVPHVRLRNGWKLIAYAFRADNNGNGLIYGVPADGCFRMEVTVDIHEIVPGVVLHAPKPAGAASSIMEVVEGDGGPESYFEASLLAREFAEFGAAWHGIAWSTHELFFDYPWKSALLRNAMHPISARSHWTFQKDEPRDWRPSVSRVNDAVLVQFFTYSALGRETIFCHQDHYEGASLVANTREQEIGHGLGGYVF